MKSMADLTIRDGIVVTPTGQVRGGLSASDGIITHLGPDSELPVAHNEMCIWASAPAPARRRCSATSRRNQQMPPLAV